MNSIYDLTEIIQNACKELQRSARLIERHQDECDYESLMNAGKRGLHITSGLCKAYRELLLSLHESIPSLPGLDRILDIECEAMGISVEQLTEFEFPVYKISLPMLLPNIRRKKADFNDAVTGTVKDAVRRFCAENSISPFDYATVILLSYCSSPQMMVDNDNKEASVIQNGLIGCFLTDDSPMVCNNVYYCKTVEDDFRTEIYIVDSEHDVEVMRIVKDI